MSRNRQIELLKSFARGVDPFTGEVLPADHVLNHPEIIRTFYEAVEAIKSLNVNAHSTQLNNAGNKWDNSEDTALVAGFDEGKSIKELSKIHKRSQGSIRSRLIRLGKIDANPNVGNLPFVNTEQGGASLANNSPTQSAETEHEPV